MAAIEQAPKLINDVLYRLINKSLDYTLVLIEKRIDNIQSRFFTYLAKPLVQQRWHQNTGYLPLGTKGVYKQLVSDSKHPSLRLAQIELVNNNEVVPALRLGPQNQIRTINDEALELIFAGIKSPQQAMDDAVIRANYVLKRFANNTSEH